MQHLVVLLTSNKPELTLLRMLARNSGGVSQLWHTIRAEKRQHSSVVHLVVAMRQYTIICLKERAYPRQVKGLSLGPWLTGGVISPCHSLPQFGYLCSYLAVVSSWKTCPLWPGGK